MAKEKNGHIGDPPAPAPLPELGLDRILAMAEDEKTEMDKVLELLLDPKNIYHNTELSSREIMGFSIMASLAQKYKLDFLKEVLAKNLIMRVSKGRSGRKEWVKIVSRMPQNQEGQDLGMGGGWRRFMRRNR